MMTAGELFTRIHTLGELTVQAIKERRNYDVFILMFERTKCIAQLEEHRHLDVDELRSLHRETEIIEGLLQEAAQRYVSAIKVEMETSAARRAYATGIALTPHHGQHHDY